MKSMKSMKEVLEAEAPKVRALVKEWSDWFNAYYPAHTNKIAMSRDILYQLNIPSYKYNQWDTTLPYLSVIHILDNISVPSKLSDADQIRETLNYLTYNQLIYVQPKHQSDIETQLYYAYKDLQKKRCSILAFVKNRISLLEPEWKEIELDPIFDTDQIGANQALTASKINPETYDRYLSLGVHLSLIF